MDAAGASGFVSVARSGRPVWRGAVDMKQTGEKSAQVVRWNLDAPLAPGPARRRAPRGALPARRARAIPKGVFLST